MIIIENSLYNLLALQSAFGVGSHKSVTILKALCKEKLLNEPIDKIVKADFIDENTKERLTCVDKNQIMRIQSDCKNNNIQIIPIYSKKYPETLKNIYSPPLVLYVKGKYPLINEEPVFCIVGTRKATEFGKKASYSLARRLSSAGMIIVSGFASGCDLSAHSGVLSVGGKSIMVVVDGILTFLNSKPNSFYNKIQENGCIISEAPPFAKAGKKYSFHIRNRLLSGLSLGVAIIEAPEGSGAVITANHAAEQGRDVFVIPGRPTQPEYKGSNALLRDGASVLLDASDIFLKYIPMYLDKIDIEKAYKKTEDKLLKKSSQKKLPSSLSKEALMVYNSIVKPEFNVEDFSTAGIDAALLLSALTELEIEHIIESLPGGNYKRLV